MHGRVQVKFREFLTSTINGIEWSATADLPPQKKLLYPLYMRLLGPQIRSRGCGGNKVVWICLRRILNSMNIEKVHTILVACASRWDTLFVACKWLNNCIVTRNNTYSGNEGIRSILRWVGMTDGVHLKHRSGKSHPLHCSVYVYSPRETRLLRLASFSRLQNDELRATLTQGTCNFNFQV
jgi:hypothetical protein